MHFSDDGTRNLDLSADTLLWLFLPDLRRAEGFHLKALELRDLTVLALGIAAFKADHNRYPKELSELAPDYVKSIPKDRFGGRDLVYKPRSNGYLLYSVGDDLKDHGGDPKKNIVIEAGDKDDLRQDF